MSKKMNALVKKYPKPGLWLEEVDMPEVGDFDVLIKMKKTAICGTDVHIYNWDEWSQATIPVPMTVGHEFVGEIVEIGKHVSGYKVGDLVSGEGHIVCGHCRNCLAGRRHLCKNTKGLVLIERVFLQNMLLFRHPTYGYVIQAYRKKFFQYLIP